MVKTKNPVTGKEHSNIVKGYHINKEFQLASQGLLKTGIIHFENDDNVLPRFTMHD